MSEETPPGTAARETTSPEAAADQREPGTTTAPGRRALPPRRWSVSEWGSDLVGPDWLARFDAVLVAIPWILLAIPLALVQTLTGTGAGGAGTDGRLLGIGLVLLTGVWVFVGHTRIDPRGRTLPPTLVYLAGLLALSAALIHQDDLYVIFAVTGILHSYHLRPWPYTTAGVLAASLVIHVLNLPPEPTGRTVGTFATIVLVQTAAIVAGYVFSDKELARHAQQTATVRRLAAVLAENELLHVQLVEQARRAGILDERRRLAGEIHDTLAQGLTGIVTQVQAAQRVWHDPGRARPHVDRALDLARDSLGEARRSVQALHPAELVGSRLPEALTDLTERWSADHEVPARCEVTGEPVVLPPATEIALFRTAQESLTNVARHAGASRVGVTLSYLDDTVLLDVRDDGVGFHAPAVAEQPRSDGFGLAGMRRRLASVGGSLAVETAPGEGTAISASVAVVPS